MTKKLYIDNPYLKEITANIIKRSCKDGNFFLELDRTIFFPNLSGAQMKDLGTIEGKEVINVYSEGNNIIHVLKDDITGSKVNLKIDWNNRFDLMQQHTGQHILSATFESLFNAKTKQSHIDKQYITIDVDILNIDAVSISQIETLANKIIQSNFKVSSKILNTNNSKEVKSSKIKKDHMDIRMVNIDNICSSPCSSVHVSSTGEIGLLKILKLSKSKGNTKVRFVCGNRALEDYKMKNKYISDISLSLACQEDDTLDKFISLKENREYLMEENNLLKETIISLKSERFLESKKNHNDIDYIMEILEDVDKDELNLIASHLNKEEDLIQIYKIEEENHGTFLISRSHNLDIDLKDIFDSISQKIIVKGGGNQDKIQGTTSTTIIDRVVEMFYKEIKAHLMTRR